MDYNLQIFLVSLAIIYVIVLVAEGVALVIRRLSGGDNESN